MYLWIDYPDFDKELQIIRAKTPNIDERLAEQICLFMQEVRQMRLEKVPGIAETLDWAQALAALHIDHLEKDLVESTLGIVLKDWTDIRGVSTSLSELFEKVGAISKLGVGSMSLTEFLKKLMIADFFLPLINTDFG
jgi:MoxR-like ATPase